MKYWRCYMLSVIVAMQSFLVLSILVFGDNFVRINCINCLSVFKVGSVCCVLFYLALANQWKITDFSGNTWGKKSSEVKIGALFCVQQFHFSKIVFVAWMICFFLLIFSWVLIFWLLKFVIYLPNRKLVIYCSHFWRVICVVVCLFISVQNGWFQLSSLISWCLRIRPHIPYSN